MWTSGITLTEIATTLASQTTLMQGQHWLPDHICIFTATAFKYVVIWITKEFSLLFAGVVWCLLVSLMLMVKNRFAHEIKWAVLHIEAMSCNFGGYRVYFSHKTLSDSIALMHLQEVNNLYEMFHIRSILHRLVYQHKTTNIVELMWDHIVSHCTSHHNFVNLWNTFVISGLLKLLWRPMTTYCYKEGKGW